MTRTASILATLGTLTAGLCASPAIAADLKGAPIAIEQQPYEPPAPIMWHGLYAGLSAGYAWGDSVQVYNRNDNHGEASVSPEGAIAALTLGYNHRFVNGLVIGAEGDLGLADVSADDKIVYDGHVYKSQFGPLWATVRGRLGFAFDTTLLYATAGAAFMDVDEVSIGNTPGETAINQDFRSGWVVGGGVEQALGSRTSIKLEYLHMDFGEYAGYSDNREDFTFENKVDLVRVGLNYKF
jgi:outer membrane immunogenic protein